MILFKNSFKIFLFIGVTALAVASCEHSYIETQQEDNNLARVGNQYLTLLEAKKQIPAFVYKEDSIQALQQFREQWIKRQLMQSQAEELGITDEESVQQKIQRAKEEIIQEALRSYLIKTEVDTVISEQEALNYFEQNRAHFILDEPFVQFRHLRTPNVEDARAAKQALRDELPWTEVADSFSTDPEQAIRNAERHFPISMVLNEIEVMNRYLQNMNVGEISAIQREDGDYHFVQLLDKREQGEHPDPEWIMDKIKSWIILNKRQRKFSSYLKNLYLKAESNNEIETYDVIPTETNYNNTTSDTLESTSTDE